MTLKKALRNPSLVAGGGIVLVLTLCAIFAPMMAPYDPASGGNLLYANEPPGPMFWLGTDDKGRDILSLLVHGARVSLGIGVGTQLVNAAIGIVLGVTAGYFGGWWDDVVSGLTGIFLTVPTLIFALAIMAVLGPGLVNVFLALGLTHWAYTCRIARSQTLVVRSLGYVQAAHLIGFRSGSIMLREILPNIAGPVLVITSLGMGAAILLEASLSFVGLGAQPPSVSWGLMLSTAREVIFTSPWMSVFPGLAIFLAVLGFNLFGDGLRDLLDPHMQVDHGK